MNFHGVTSMIKTNGKDANLQMHPTASSTVLVRFLTDPITVNTGLRLDNLHTHGPHSLHAPPGRVFGPCCCFTAPTCSSAESPFCQNTPIAVRAGLEAKQHQPPPTQFHLPWSLKPTSHTTRQNKTLVVVELVRVREDPMRLNPPKTPMCLWPCHTPEKAIAHLLTR
ncbi:hypothetical protein D4764_05G0003270 [Takifugu flavidus]|uniref:Uncharacterized protein n=1 Tax=Takifugu flavidus TaxID=433684 RepID=A0A5C6N3D7_9TELE|nr:hypothetical protein D4764_05G0003270 [Takifugu flavidus]